jgi:tRNA threonylcarbamoyladenosine biosynthesis protein TsaB
MRILGVDTSTSVASTAVVDNGQIVAEDFYPRVAPSGNSGAIPHNHVEIILPLVASVLHQAGIGLPDVAGIAVAAGPGSFTGVRIGLSTVKGLVYGTGVPAVGISTLQANAARVIDFDGIVCSLLDARKNEVYAAVFRKSGNSLQRLTEDAVVPVLSVFERLRSLDEPAPCFFIGDGVIACRPLIEQVMDLQPQIAADDTMPSMAASVARLGESQFIEDRVASLNDLVPIYLRRPECQSHMKVASK